MNIIEYALRLGKTLNKIETGKELKGIFEEVTEKYVTNKEDKILDHYSIYNQCVEGDCARNHFFGWMITYEKMKQYIENKDEGDKILLETAKYVINNDDIKQLTYAGDHMGKLAVKITDAIISANYEDEEIKKIMKFPKIKNAIVDLQMGVERSGFKYFLIKNANVLLSEKLNNDYEMELRRNNYIPYVGDKNPSECADNISETYKDVIDRLLFIQHTLLMGIFEGFWNILIVLNENDEVKKEFSQPQGIKKCDFSHKNIGKEIINKEAWLYKINLEQDYFYFIANRRTTHFGNKEEKTEVYGVCYPREDLGLFEKDTITE